MTDSQILAETLSTYGFVVTDEQCRLLRRYCEQLWNWNTRLNLTRHTDSEAFVTRDLNDTQQLNNHLHSGESVLDVGSGGGVPGIVLAILNQSLNISLSESTQKKAVALEAIVAELGLSIPVLSERAENIVRRQSFDTITARAVAPLRKLLPWFQPQRHRIGRLLLVKGPSWQTECDEAQLAGLMKRVEVSVLTEYATVGRDGPGMIAEVRFR